MWWVCEPAITSRRLRMICYQLARNLKDAGFPQSELARAQQQLSLPTLSTLIEACGENFGALRRESHCWVACEYISERGEWTNAHEGETPRRRSGTALALMACSVGSARRRPRRPQMMYAILRARLRSGPVIRVSMFTRMQFSSARFSSG